MKEMMNMQKSYSHIRGFNYQPSYGTTEVDTWLKFNPDIVELELGRGKKYFPKMNAIRVWLSWGAFKCDPNRLSASFGRLLDIAERYDLAVMPLLFNRWHDPFLDWGGIYVDHFYPKLSWVSMDEQRKFNKKWFDPYLTRIVGEHARDDRVFMWDLCNEPFSYYGTLNEFSGTKEAEFAWLQNVYDTCKSLGARAPLCVGMHPGYGIKGTELVESISDVLTIHPYYVPRNHTRIEYERELDGYVELSKKVGKPLLASETCWGAVEDVERVEIIRYTLSQLKKRGIGWLCHALHHSFVTDLHRPEYGPVGPPGYMAFIEKDGSLRKGHEIFNEF